jgi:hypothetical protein
VCCCSESLCRSAWQGIGVFNVTSVLPHVIFGIAVILASFSLPIIA